MNKLKSVGKNRDFQSVVIIISLIFFLIFTQEVFNFGREVSFSLAPLAAMGYFISYRSGWRGVIMAILANAIMVLYVLSLSVEAFNLIRATNSLIINSFGYCLIGWLSESLKAETIRANYLGEIQLARFRASFEETEGHILKAMTAIETKQAITGQETIEDKFIISELKRAQSLLAKDITLAEVAHQLVSDKETLGLINKNNN